MLVFKEKVEAYRIGEKLFIVDEEGFLREVPTGGLPNDDEWVAYRKFEEERFEEQKEREENERSLEEEYERCIQEEQQRHEQEMERIHFEVFGN